MADAGGATCRRPSFELAASMFSLAGPRDVAPSRLASRAFSGSLPEPTSIQSVEVVMQTNIAEAKARLSELLAAAENGEGITPAAEQKPVFRIGLCRWGRRAGA